MTTESRHEAEQRGLSADETAELARLRDFFDNAQLGLHWVGPDGTILRANRADYEPLGYTEDEYVGHNIVDFHDDAGVIADILDRLSRGETLDEYPARLRCKDGSVRDVRINSSVNFVEGEFVNTRCLTRDVTDEVRADRAIRLSEERYATLVRLFPVLIVITNAAGEIDDISESYSTYTGLTLAQAKDWATHQVIHPDDMEQSMERWSAALATGEPMQNEMRLRRHDGVYRWYLVEAAPLRDNDGTITRWMTVNIDIEDRKRAEEHQRYLADATARLVLPLDSPELLASIALLAVPSLADICAIGLFDGSAATARVETAGATEAEREYVDAIHLRRWLAAPGEDRTIGQTIAAGLPVFAPDFSGEWIAACAPDDTQRMTAEAIDAISLICVPILSGGQPAGMATFATTRRSGRRYSDRDFLLLREVAARLSIAIENSRLLDDLRNANAAKDEFLGLVSHELKTPLTTIRGNAEILLRNEARISAEDQHAALTDIVREGDRLHRIIENLLLLARLDQGQPLEREPLLVIRVVERVINRPQRRYLSREFEVIEDESARRPVSFVEDYLDQVIENLISNAEKYSPDDAPITVEIEQDANEVRVRVLDRGIGIAERDAASLFEPFYRSPALKDHPAGLGIGLTVCKRLVEAQGGRVWAQPRPGGGSEFGFALPIVRDGEEVHVA